MNDEKQEKTDREHEKENKNERKREREEKNEKNEKDEKDEKEKKQQSKKKIYGFRQSFRDVKDQLIKFKNDFQEFNKYYNIKPKHYFNTLLLMGSAVLLGIYYYDPFSTISYEVNYSKFSYYFLLSP